MNRGLAAFAALGVGASVLVGAPAATADAVRDKQYWLDDYGIREAWNTTRGAGITIAVIDTGVDGRVRDLSGAVIDGSDFSGIGTADGQTPVGSDGANHGTMVASLAAGRGTGAGSGVIGAAPEASVISASIGFGEGTTASDVQIPAAVRWAVDHGADIINMSLTRNTIDWPETWDDAFLYAMEHDVIVVAAAGNRGSGTVEVGAPATMPGVLTVAGVDVNGNASSEASSQGITIGVAAPSEDLVGVVPGGGYVLWNGTSGAAPIVSGVAALVRAAHPELDAANVINRIVATSKDVGVPGADPLYGFGLIDADAAVNSDVPAVTTNPMGDLAAWIRLNRRAEPSATPTPPAAPTPTPAPPSAAEPANPLGTVLPTVNLLRNVGIPLGLFALLGAATVVITVRAVRAFRAERRTE